VNTSFLERFPRDAQALNRRGRALLELGRLQEAWDAYSEALNADPANMIARRNLQRLEMLAASDAPVVPAAEQVSSRAAVSSSKRSADVGRRVDSRGGRCRARDRLSRRAAELRDTRRRRDRLVARGKPLGELEQRIAQRLIDLTEAGIAFEMYALGMSGHASASSCARSTATRRSSGGWACRARIA